jgi:ParB family transcriptional regulator, chromosome partitioning protein
MKPLFDEIPPGAHILNNEWYTPPRYCDAAREVMGGGIDLDPASCEMANVYVKAARYYTREEDGLVQPWEGRIWCNPPFSAIPGCPAPMPIWSDKVIFEFTQGHIEQAVLLVKADTRNPWFHRLFDYAAICLSLHRIQFIRPGRKTEELREGIAFAYFGPHISRFVEVFTEFGSVLTPEGIHRKREKTLAVQSPLWDEGGAA